MQSNDEKPAGNLLDRLGWAPLIMLAIFLGGAPFVPQPHLVEKVRWIMEGTPLKPIDWFDMLWHSWPFILIAIKAWRMRRTT